MSSGVAPLALPFYPITFYAIPSTTGVLVYNFTAVSTLANSVPASIIAGVAPTAVTVHFLLNYTGASIDWFSQPASVQDPAAVSAIPRSQIQITAGSPSVNSATITSATNKVSSPTAVRQSHGISDGAAAGVAIGCLIAGALIAGLILWFCWGRRKAQRSRYSETGAISLTPFEKGPLAHNRFLGSGSHAQLGAITGLPQPLEDQAISGEVSKISNLIKNHVQSYYHNRTMSPGIVGVNGIVELGEGLPFPAGTLSTLLDNIATREVALRFSIAWAIISRLQNYDDPSRTLLPHEVWESLRNITKAEHGSKVHNSMVARWRVSTAELMQTAYVDNAFTTSDSRNSSIQTLTYTLEKILQPFADSRINNEQRKRNLEEILKRSASFAFTLFSQSSTWDFDWKKGVKSGDICIFPALVQMTNEAGEPVRPPRYFSKAVTRKLGG
ncbi:hypothetical protein EJ07DRAFT_173382 [Lizonia empirigonia]|nr:hypothetical protein EJ07DRAFT_173382 [Lizonia empirigonia]